MLIEKRGAVRLYSNETGSSFDNITGIIQFYAESSQPTNLNAEQQAARLKHVDELSRYFRAQQSSANYGVEPGTNTNIAAAHKLLNDYGKGIAVLNVNEPHEDVAALLTHEKSKVLFDKWTEKEKGRFMLDACVSSFGRSIIKRETLRTELACSIDEDLKKLENTNGNKANLTKEEKLKLQINELSSKITTLEMGITALRGLLSSKNGIRNSPQTELIIPTQQVVFPQ